MHTMEQTLLLNATFEPVKVIDWQKAITLLTLGKVEVLAEHDREIRSITFRVKLPSVLRLLRYVRMHRDEHVAFTRANIYARDQYECQYCGETFGTEELTFDHVIPVTQGGTKSWENIVSACVACNKRKGGRTPAEARMVLLRQPMRPSTTLTLRLSVSLKKAPKSWMEWLYFHGELERT